LADEEVGESSKAESVPPSEPTPEGVSRSVFLSYASHDADTANAVCQFVDSHGLSCWLLHHYGGEPLHYYVVAIRRLFGEFDAIQLLQGEVSIFHF